MKRINISRPWNNFNLLILQVRVREENAEIVTDSVDKGLTGGDADDRYSRQARTGYRRLRYKF